MRDRVLLLGGFDGAYRNDTWVLGDLGWSVLPAPAGPLPRSNHTAIYDALRDRLILFGGASESGYLNDVWILPLNGAPVWSQLVPSGAAPSPRFSHSAVYDPVRDRMIVFAGDDGGLTVLDDCWVLELSGTPAWISLSPGGGLPPGRRAHTAVYDPVRDRMVVFGGDDGALWFNDAWALSMTALAWSPLAAAGTPPSVRSGHTAAYDPAGDRMLLFGGSNGAYRSNEAWSLSLAGTPAWSVIASSGLAPTPRSHHSMVLDPIRGCLVVIGGWDGSYRNDVHELTLLPSPVWSAVLDTAALPPARYRHTTIIDPAGRRLLLFGGYEGIFPYPNSVWALSLDDSPSWGIVGTSGGTPLGRYGHTAIFDPGRDRMLVFGGHTGGSRVSEVWSLALGGFLSWTMLAPTGSTPSARQNHTAIYDPVRDRMLVFGGFDGVRRNDVWSLALGSSTEWTNLAPAGTPPSPRTNHAAIYDPVHDRMLVFGGSDGVARNDVWALALGGAAAWSELTPAGTAPSARAGHTAIYDPVGDRMVIFGGEDSSLRNDVWALALTDPPTWLPLAPDGTVPPGRRYHTANYDPWKDGMVVSSGWGGYYRGDVVELVWGAPARPVLTCPGDRTALPGELVSLGYALQNPLSSLRAVEWRLSAERNWPGLPLHGVSLVEGGAELEIEVSIAVPDTSVGSNTLRFSASFQGAAGNDSACAHSIVVAGPPVDAAGETGHGRLALDQIGPNPVHGTMHVSFSTSRPGRVILEVFDAAGRRTAIRREMEVTPGMHAVSVPETRSMVPGVYFVRLTQGSESRSERVVLVRRWR